LLLPDTFQPNYDLLGERFELRFHYVVSFLLKQIVEKSLLEKVFNGGGIRLSRLLSHLFAQAHPDNVESCSIHLFASGWAHFTPLAIFVANWGFYY